MLKALMLRAKIDAKRTELAKLKDNDFAERERKLEISIGEATTEEERSFLDAEIEKFEAEKRENEEAVTALEGEISDLEAELDELEKNNDSETEAPEEVTPEDDGEETNRTRGPIEIAERSIVMPEMTRRVGLYALNAEQRSELLADKDVKKFLDRARVCISERRALTNVGLTIPQNMLPLIRQIVEANSKLIGRVTMRTLTGTARQNIMGEIPEAVWTEMCAVLNELTIGFNNVEVDGWKVGGYFAVCNAIIEDSDLNLANELLTALGISIAKALDKAIVYGTGTKMPLGIVTRLAQTAEPANYGATERTWADLHTSNVLTGTGATGIALFKEIALRTKVVINNYHDDGLTWIMNKRTHLDLLVQSMDKNLNASLVAGMNNSMPVVGGDIVELNFIPDGNIVFGYMPAYLLVQRAGVKLGQSEHVRFIEDQTVFRGTARYDGKPVIAEAFGVLTLTNTAPTTSGISFAADAANTVAETTDDDDDNG